MPRRLWVALAATSLVAAACTQAVSGQPEGAQQPPLRSPSVSSTSPAPGGSASSAPAAPTPSAIDFRDCTQQLLAAGLPVPSGLAGKVSVGCGQLPVPLDYEHPHGKQITITVIPIHNTDNS